VKVFNDFVKCSDFLQRNPIYNTIGWISEKILKRKSRKFVTEAQRGKLSEIGQKLWILKS
jgi:hypothetical protein